MIRVLTVFCALLLGSAPAVQAERPVYVFAATSLGRALEEIAQDFDAELVLDFGGSGTLARQAAAGAPVDVLVLANLDWMRWLTDQGHAKADDVRMIAANSLVVIGQTGAAPLAGAAELSDRLGTDRLAMGHRDAVPAGIYARQWLQSIDLWPELADQLAETDNVWAALVLVARGQLPYGVVYASDTTVMPGVEVIYHVPPDSHDRILYPAVALTPEGEAFMAHLTSESAAQRLVANGFRRVTP